MEATPELKAALAALPPRFWGSIELLIQNGEIIILKTTSTQKLKDRDTRHDRNYTR